MRSHSALPPSQIDKIVHENRKIHKMWLGRLLERFNLGNLPHKVHLINGEPDELIVEMVKKKGIELVAQRYME